MSLLCRLAGHVPEGDPIWNYGYSFARCGRCRSDIIHSGEQWSLVPRGHRVVWKAGFHQHSIPADYRRTLPVLHEGEKALPRQPLHVWHRQLLLLASNPHSSSDDPIPSAGEEEDPEPRYPALFALAILAGMTVELVQRLNPARDFH